MTDNEKKKYDDQAAKDKVRYENEMETAGSKVKPSKA
jgi:hypothetical protein